MQETVILYDHCITVSIFLSWIKFIIKLFYFTNVVLTFLNADFPPRNIFRSTPLHISLTLTILLLFCLSLLKVKKIFSWKSRVQLTVPTRSRSEIQVLERKITRIENIIIYSRTIIVDEFIVIKMHTTTNMKIAQFFTTFRWCN